MKITVIGAGAAGLCSAIILRRAFRAEVEILESQQESEAPGLGIALLPFSLDALALICPDSPLARSESFVWTHRSALVFAGYAGATEVVRQPRVQDTVYRGAKRAMLLAELKAYARKTGVAIVHDCAAGAERIQAAKDTSNLLIGADGAGSPVRAHFADAFRPASTEARSRFAWLALEGSLDRFVFGYIYVPGKGLIRITAYPHAEGECSAIITHSMGLTDYFDAEGMTEADGTISETGLAAINAIFHHGLEGRKIFGRARWRRFRATHCRRAVFDNLALVGDSFTTLFYETGWGTSAAIQQARILGHALGQSLAGGQSIAAGLAIYDRKSLEISRGLVTATARTVREVDGQAAKFFKHGPEKFLTLAAA